MVDLIGSVTSQVTTALTGTRSASSGREQVSINHSTSPEEIDEVSISNTAMEIGRVMEIVQEAKSRIESEPQVALSSDTERLSMLV